MVKRLGMRATAWIFAIYPEKRHGIERKTGCPTNPQPASVRGLTSSAKAIMMNRLVDGGLGPSQGEFAGRQAGRAQQLPPRSMVGQPPLERHIGVRIPGGQPIENKRDKHVFRTFLPGRLWGVFFARFPGSCCPRYDFELSATVASIDHLPGP